MHDSASSHWHTHTLELTHPCIAALPTPVTSLLHSHAVLLHRVTERLHWPEAFATQICRVSLSTYKKIQIVIGCIVGVKQVPIEYKIWSRDSYLSDTRPKCIFSYKRWLVSKLQTLFGVCLCINNNKLWLCTLCTLSQSLLYVQFIASVT